MFNKIIEIFKISDLRKKILMVALLLLCFRILAAIPVPGINSESLRNLFASSQLFGFLNIFSGGALENLSIIMLGVGPYITTTIILQLLTILFPRLKEIYYEEGEQGRARFNRLSRYLTVPLGALQGYGFLNLLTHQGVLPPLGTASLIINVTVITAGSVLLMWIGEMIDEYKIGNGISMIIFAGIVSGLPSALRNIIFSYNPQDIPTYIAYAVLTVIVVAGVVFINEGERKIPVSYAKRVRGNKLYGGASSYLPLKVNQAGVIPIIFAVSILLFPQFFAQTISIFSPDLSIKLTELVNKFFANLLIYSAIYFVLVVVFTYFYTAITFDPEEIAKNLQRSGGFIPGIRPGASTGEFISKIVNRTTLFGALFLGVIAILPNLVQLITGISALTLGGTALLIVVSVALDTMKQIQSQVIMREYEGFL
ncbi:MAG: preprotein translocase subunit SecY [Candidatus Brennerbacteria bacterium]|nr:preprotein translocase subunit SecY [Candidatus Brennerbacteria bacterium]